MLSYLPFWCKSRPHTHTVPTWSGTERTLQGRRGRPCPAFGLHQSALRNSKSNITSLHFQCSTFNNQSVNPLPGKVCMFMHIYEAYKLPPFSFLYASWNEFNFLVFIVNSNHPLTEPQSKE